MQKLRACFVLVTCVAVTLLTGCAQQSGLDQLKEYEKTHPCNGNLANDRDCTLMSRIELDSGKTLAKQLGLSHVYQARLAPAKYGWRGFAAFGTQCIVGFNFIGVPANSGRVNAALFSRYGTSSQPTLIGGASGATENEVRQALDQKRTECGLPPATQTA